MRIVLAAIWAGGSQVIEAICRLAAQKTASCLVEHIRPGARRMQLPQDQMSDGAPSSIGTGFGKPCARARLVMTFAKRIRALRKRLMKPIWVKARVELGKRQYTV